METIVKILKAMFFNEGELDIKFTTKVKYVIYGMILAIILEATALALIQGEEEEEPAMAGQVYEEEDDPLL